MAEISVVSNTASSAEVNTIYEEIKRTLGTPFVPGLFKAMAAKPDYLAATWNQFKSVMGSGALSRREKELVALAVSATNNCRYCIQAHTAILKGLGLEEEGIVELLAVVGVFNNFNKFADGLMIEPDVGL